MIKHIHRHLHKKTHLPTVGMFAVVASIAIIATVAFFEFSPQTGKPQTARALFGTTPCTNAGYTTPLNGRLLIATVPVQTTSTTNIQATLNATSAMPDTACVRINVWSGVSATKSYYTNLNTIGAPQAGSSGMNWTLAVPLVELGLVTTSTSITTDNYQIQLAVFATSASYLSNTSTSFDYTTPSGGLSVQPFILLSPTTSFTTMEPFTVTVRRPTDITTLPVMVRARIDGAGILLPWKRVGETSTWTPVSGSTTDFRSTVSSIPSYETYAYRACPGSVASDTYTLPERCSNEVRVTYVAATTTNSSTTVNVPGSGSTTNVSPTNNTTTTTNRPAPPTITNPAIDGKLNELYRVSGRTDRGTVVKVDILRFETNTSQPSPVLTREVPSTDIESYATYSAPIDALRPGNYRVTAMAKKNGVWSDLRVQHFSIVPIDLKIMIPDWSTTESSISGIVTITVQSNRSDLGKVSIYRRGETSTAAPAVLIGDAQRVSGSSTTWTLSFDAASQPDGAWVLFGVADVAGASVASPPLSVTLAGSEPNIDEENDPSSDPIDDEEPVLDPSIPIDDEEIGEDDPSVPVDDEFGEDETNTNTPTTNTSTTNTNRGTTTPIDTQVPKVLPPEVDPRKSGTAVPERMAVEAVTTLATQTNTPTGLQLTGFGPPDTIVTVYIFSNPIVLTTKTDANGNWSITLDRQLDNGSHEVYVTLTDDAGQVQEKSNPLSFFVAEARAVSAEDYRQFEATQARASDNYLRYYIALSALIVAFTITLILYLRLSRKHNQLKAAA